jgi:hypothetical protein
MSAIFLIESPNVAFGSFVSWPAQGLPQCPESGRKSCNAANNLVIRFANNHELRKFAGRLPGVILLWPRNGPRSGDGLFGS